MELNDYQQKAVTTAIYKNEAKIIYPILGLAGEAGEVANKYKKVIRDNNNFLTKGVSECLSKELGDCLWYIANIANDLGFTLEEIASNNLEKLFGRKERGTISGSGDER